MATTTFDVRARAVECNRCGAPIETPSQGGEIQCRYCGAINFVTTRAEEAPRRHAPASMADEVARRSRLKAQLENPIEGHPYDLHRVPLGRSEGMIEGPSGRERLRAEWTRAKAAVGRSSEEQRGLLWLAVKLAGAEQKQGQALQARAVLETVIGLLTDAGHRDLARCRLVCEAVRAGDAESAEGWLAECDPAPEVIELDSAYREAAARVKSARRDFDGVISIVGERADDVPTQAAVRPALATLRVHALESLGHLEQASAELDAAVKEHGEAEVLTALVDGGMAPRSVARAQRQRLAKLAEERDAQPTGVRALAAPLASFPVIAPALLITVTMPRCFFDADPFLGAHGYVLCPHVCSGCEGPFRIYTEWSHNGGEHSTNGPQYFCETRTNRVGTMSDKEMETRFRDLHRYELSWAPAAATYLTLLLMLLSLAPFLAMRRHAVAALRRRALESEIGTLATTLGEPVPEAPGRPSYAGLRSALAVFSGAALASLLIVLLELALQ